MIGGFQSGGVKVNACIDHARLLLHKPGHATVVGGANDKRANLLKIPEHGTG